MTVTITTPCHYDVWHNAECHNLFIVMLNVVMLSVTIMLKVVIRNVVMLIVLGPLHFSLGLSQPRQENFSTTLYFVLISLIVIPASNAVKSAALQLLERV
jgi:hypothetical protein